VSRESIKKILKSVGCGNLIRIYRTVKSEFYRFLDAGGKIIFYILRGSRIISETTALDPNRINKIMIIRADRIGDLVLSTPSFAALRKRYPKSYISLVVQTYTKDLVFNNPVVDEVIDFDPKMPVMQKINFFLKFKKYRYDLVAVLHSTLGWGFFAYLSGAPYRIGYSERGGGFLLTIPIPLKDDAEVVHELERTLDIVKRVGADIEDKHPYVSVTEKGERFAKKFFENSGIKNTDRVVAMHPGARQAYIRWRAEGFAAVADMIIEKYFFKILLIGGESENTIIKDVNRGIKNKNFIVTALGVELTELVSLIKRCVLFVGNSTGPMHIATALDVPVVAIFGSVHPLDSFKKWGPWGDGHSIVSKDLNCNNCHPSDCETYDCMNLIEPEDVMKAITKQIGKMMQ